MRSRLRLIVLLAAVVALGAGVYGSYRLLQETDITIPTFFRPAPGKRLLISMDGFRFVQSENGRVAWRMSARTTSLFENREALLNDIEIVFSDPDGRTAALVGETGTMDTLRGNATIRRGAREVRIVTSDGYLLTTDSLAWKAGERIVRTADPFKLLGKEIYLEGVGLSAAVDMRKVVVDSNVKAVLQE